MEPWRETVVLCVVSPKEFQAHIPASKQSAKIYGDQKDSFCQEWQAEGSMEESVEAALSEL